MGGPILRPFAAPARPRPGLVLLETARAHVLDPRYSVGWLLSAPNSHLRPDLLRPNPSQDLYAGATSGECVGAGGKCGLHRVALVAHPFVLRQIGPRYQHFQLARLGDFDAGVDHPDG